MTGQDFMWNLTAGFMQIVSYGGDAAQRGDENAEFIILEIWILTG